MKKIAIITSLALSIFMLHANAKECSITGKIDRLDFGWVEGLNYGNDGGNAIAVTIEGKSISSAHGNHNLNDDSGKIFASVLTTAYIVGATVTLYDHNKGDCKAFDQVTLIRNK